MRPGPKPTSTRPETRVLFASRYAAHHGMKVRKAIVGAPGYQLVQGRTVLIHDKPIETVIAFLQVLEDDLTFHGAQTGVDVLMALVAKASVVGWQAFRPGEVAPIKLADAVAEILRAFDPVQRGKTVTSAGSIKWILDLFITASNKGWRARSGPEGDAMAFDTTVSMIISQYEAGNLA